MTNTQKVEGVGMTTGWHYDEVEAERVGHPWMSDPRWGNDSYVTEFGQFIALFVLCCFAAGGMLVIALASAPVWLYRKLRGDM